MKGGETHRKKKKNLRVKERLKEGLDDQSEKGWGERRKGRETWRRDPLFHNQKRFDAARKTRRKNQGKKKEFKRLKGGLEGPQSH